MGPNVRSSLPAVVEGKPDLLLELELGLVCALVERSGSVAGTVVLKVLARQH